MEDVTPGQLFREALRLGASLREAWLAYFSLVPYEPPKQLPPELVLKLPLVRRVFANPMCFDLVSVQPMTMPSANLFYLDYLYQGKV